jgi:hypothetical protein
MEENKVFDQDPQFTDPYVIVLRIDVDKRADHPAHWDWAALLDLPNSGGVQVLLAEELSQYESKKR